MPEWGMIPIPAKLLRDGVTDMVRISDARMSGTAFGTVVLHVAPEAAARGPLAVVRDGDPIVLDVEAQRLDVDPEDCAYVGDSPFDIRAAKAAGMFAVAVTWGGIHDRNKLDAEHPDATVDNADELYAVL